MNNTPKKTQIRVGLKLQTGIRAGTDPALITGNYSVADGLRGSATNLLGR